MTDMGILSSGSIKIEKSPSAHVWNCKIGLKCRVMFLFIFADRYDPKEAYKHTCWALDTNKKIFATLKVKYHIHQKAIFMVASNWSMTLLPLKEYQN